MFDKDIVLDEAAFQKAVDDFAALSKRLESLRKELDEMMKELKKGFDTPAGRKFISSCQTNLFQPMNDQKVVLDHISETLKESKVQYSSVFAKYEEMNAAMKRVGD